MVCAGDALGDAGCHQSGLRAHRTCQGTERTQGDPQTRRPERAAAGGLDGGTGHRHVHGGRRRGRVGVQLARHRAAGLAGHPDCGHSGDHGRGGGVGIGYRHRQPAGGSGVPVAGSEDSLWIRWGRVAPNHMVRGLIEMGKRTGGEHMRQRRMGLAGLVGFELLGSPVGPTWGQNRGNAMTVTFKDDISTLDPAIGYDWQNWSIIKSIFDGLMDYEPGTTKLVPHLAESFTVSGDGKSYTFKLRRGVKFHNGREVTAADVKYSLERTLNPKTQSPGAGFFGDIVGTKEFADGKAKEGSGIKTADTVTLAFTLRKTYDAFLHIIAMNFAHGVPKEEIEKAGADFGHKPVGSGA